jgi:hypothetical protein
VALAAVATLGLGVGACDGDDDQNAGSDGIDVSDAWARSSPAGVTAGAAYMTIVSAGDDQLVGVAVPSDIAATVELHESVVGGGQDAATTDDHDTTVTEDPDAAMTMRPLSVVELPSGEAVAFEPGGLHMMLVDLARPLESGSSFDLTLEFATAAPKTVSVDIRDEAP